MSVQAATDLLRLLSDPTRLRLLRLLAASELSVLELAEVAQLSQSRISNHLKLLREEGLVVERPEGAFRHYRVDLDRMTDSARRLWPWVEEMWGGDDTLDGDMARLRAVVSRRDARDGGVFDRLAGEWDTMRSQLFGDSIARELLRAFVPRDLVVADIGAGTGYSIELFGDRPRRLVCIDRSKAMLAVARKKVAALGLDSVEFRVGDAHEPPLGEGEAGMVLFTMVLHHLDDPARAIANASRALAPGGMLFIADLSPHHQLWLREHLGHRHLGFSRQEVTRWLREAGVSGESFAALPGRQWLTPEGKKAVVPDGFAVIGRRLT